MSHHLIIYVIISKNLVKCVIDVWGGGGWKRREKYFGEKVLGGNVGENVGGNCRGGGEGEECHLLERHKQLMFLKLSTTIQQDFNNDM